jgi:O-methyltransferase involved in polyketide biosynthesis
MAQRDYAKISITAIGVAFARARFTCMPFVEEIFEKARKYADKMPFYTRLPKRITRAGNGIARVAGFGSGLEARYLSTNLFLESLDDSWTIVEIASGISPRSLEWSDKRPGVQYIETDLPGMLATKQRIFNEIVAEKGMTESPNHHFMELNALDPEAWNRLGQAYFVSRAANVVVINEGLLSYFSRDEKVRLRDSIAGFFRNFAAEGASEGAWVSPDFANLVKRRNSQPSKWARKRAEARVGRLYDRFNNLEEVVALLEAGGFRCEFLPNDVLKDRMTCISYLKLKPDQIERELHQHQALVAKLA